MKSLNKVAVAVSVVLSGCTGTGVYQQAAEANDVALTAVLAGLCDPLRTPALYRRFENQPEQMQAIATICNTGLSNERVEQN